MTALLDLPEVRQRWSPLSVEEYHRLGEFNENGKRTELIRGIVVEKMSKSPLHGNIATRLYKAVLQRLPAGFTARKEEPLTLTDSEPEPDLSVVRGRDEDFAQSHPTTAALVVEVAVSSLGLDRELAAVYAEAGVEEYWIVNGADRRVEVHRQPVDGIYQECLLLGEGEELTCATVPGLRLAWSDVFP